MRIRRVTILAATAALVLAASAAAAAIAVTVNLQGGTGSRTLKACGALHHFTLYRAGATIKIDGAVRPAPASFRVKLKVKQCLRGAFRTVWTGGAHEAAGGTFHGVYVARRRGMFSARAYVRVGTATIKSDKRHFQVR